MIPGSFNYHRPTFVQEAVSLLTKLGDDGRLLAGGHSLIPTMQLRLAALRHLFDWMVTGQIMPTNPAAAVRGPLHIVRRGKTPVLDPAEARQLIDAIDATTIIGLRDRALIGLMVSSFARIGAAINMRVEDVYTRRTAAFGCACVRRAVRRTPCRATIISKSI